MIVTHAQKWLLFLDFLMGFMAVALGAFGAHALKHKLTTEMLSIFDVGVRYQIYHVLAIPIAVWVSIIMPGRVSSLSGWFFLFGTLIFSGSLYLLVWSGVRTLGAITPIGGVLLLMGWLCLAMAVFLK